MERREFCIAALEGIEEFEEYEGEELGISNTTWCKIVEYIYDKVFPPPSDQEADNWFMQQPEEVRREINEQVRQLCSQNPGMVEFQVQREIIKEKMP